MMTFAGLLQIFMIRLLLESSWRLMTRFHELSPKPLASLLNGEESNRTHLDVIK